MGKGSDMNLSEYKDIIKFAMENEIEAKKFYEEAAEKVENTQLKEMFADFADRGKAASGDLEAGLYQQSDG